MTSPDNGAQVGSARVNMVAPMLLRWPIIGMSALLVFSAPCSASTGPVGVPVSIASRPARGQWRMVHAYERYLAGIKAQRIGASRAVRFAYRQLGKPYRWGGAGPRSYDCSGLTMVAWRKGGLSLPHRADIQYRTIRRKVPMRSLRPGDLVFFSRAHHVGIYVGRGRFIHAPHTGTVIQRGALTGWRRRVFAGAARPGAPAYRAWPGWVRTLAGLPQRRVTGSVTVPTRPSPGHGSVSVPTRPTASSRMVAVPDRQDASPEAAGVPDRPAVAAGESASAPAQASVMSMSSG